MTRDELLVYNVVCFLAAQHIEDPDLSPAAYAGAFATEPDTLREHTEEFVALAEAGEKYIERVESFDGPRAMLLTVHDGGEPDG